MCLTHSSQARTRFASSISVQIGLGNVPGLDCEGSRVLPNMFCPQCSPDPSDDTLILLMYAWPQFHDTWGYVYNKKCRTHAVGGCVQQLGVEACERERKKKTKFLITVYKSETKFLWFSDCPPLPLSASLQRTFTLALLFAREDNNRFPPHCFIILAHTPRVTQAVAKSTGYSECAVSCKIFGF